MVIKCHAKINLALQVKGTREDGYHLLSMVNLPIDLHDVIEIESLPYYKDTYIVCDELRLLNGHSNICMKVIEHMRAKCGFQENFLVRIHKGIPSAAGLGGGSSDAANVMMAVNHMLKLGLSTRDLCELSLPVGSDIPFFLHGKPALVEGIGNIVTPITVKKTYHALIIKPEKGLSTKDVYKACNETERLLIDTSKVVDGLVEGDDGKIIANFGNDLFPAAKKLLPEVADIVAELRKDGFPLSAMTGSGSCCYALSCDAKTLKSEEKKWIKKGYDTYLTKLL
ncbi:MAG: 4-(cytidine 5'-diphospho)-2-C-methyl-D-erythritol kinase [Bacilli bacterium]|nr:4-(cytidine 5'-diphospho)-2-C-methyl-D-erythritol kinase [Bacilli bacterium]